MFIIEYISHKFQGEERDSVHQYLTKHAREHYDAQPEDLRIELRNFYHENAYPRSVKKSQLFALPKLP